MDDEVALLHGIMIDPDSDVRRLAYADWLDERGALEDEARARFIRAQVHRVRDVDGSMMPVGELALLDEFEDRWRHWLPNPIRRGGYTMYERGFPSKLECRAELVLSEWERGPILLPIEALTLHILQPSPSWLSLSAPCPMLPLRYLRVRSETPVGSLLMGAVLKLGPFPRLTELALRDGFLSDDALGDFRPDPALPALRRLSLAGCNVGDEGAEALAESGWAGRLERLDLTGNPISPSRVEWLRRRFGAALTL